MHKTCWNNARGCFRECGGWMYILDTYFPKVEVIELINYTPWSCCQMYAHQYFTLEKFPLYITTIKSNEEKSYYGVEM